MSANIIQVAKKKKSKVKPLIMPLAEAKGVVKGSVFKTNRVLDIIRGMEAGKAMQYLYFSPYSCAKSVAKIVKSAVMNAVDLGLVSETQISSLVISEIFANQGMVLRRMKAASKGKGSPRMKRYSRIFIKIGKAVSEVAEEMKLASK